MLFGGLVAAALVYAFADTPGRDAAAEIASGRVYDYNIERIGGKSMVYATRFNQWLGTLWQGQALAVTIGVLALVVGGGCLLFARSLAARDESARDGSPGDRPPRDKH